MGNYQVGQPVFGNWYNYMEWYPGVIQSWNRDQCCAVIRYDDGDVEDQCAYADNYRWNCDPNDLRVQAPLDVEGGYGDYTDRRYIGCPQGQLANGVYPDHRQHKPVWYLVLPQCEENNGYRFCVGQFV